MRLYGIERKGCRGSRSRPRRVAVASSSGCAGDGDVNTVTPRVSRSCGLRSNGGDRTAWNHADEVTQAFRIPDSVVTVTRQRGSIGDGIDHPAVFLVALPEFILNACSDLGEIVLDPFGGSGTTMLAAQRTGRIARSVEIAPEYVDVAIKRFGCGSFRPRETACGSTT
jgi:hypothetical protein